MPLELLRCAPADALRTLAEATRRAKGTDRLAPVTVIVPTNVAGVMARRGLGRDSGVLGVDMVTLNRLAELLAGPALAHAGRRPVSNPLLDLTIRQVLEEAPGSFEPVARHPATVVALRELHQELRLADPERLEALARTRRGREAKRVSDAVTRILQRRWYDEADLFDGAVERLRSERVDGLADIILHLPRPFEHAARRFVEQLAADRSVTIVSAFTGSPDADTDAAPRRVAEQFSLDLPESTEQYRSASPAAVVSVTDADDEVRVAVRTIVDAARGALTGTPVPLERIAVLWPSHRPYARLVEHHLNADGIGWNGPGGTELVERIAPRLLLELLGLDRRGLQRRTLFEFLADLPVRDEQGRALRTGEWERVSRVAGLSGDDDWERRLRRLTTSDRWSEPATSLLEFVTDLRARLGRHDRVQPWSAWVEWCADELAHWLGPGAISRFSDPEYRAWEQLMTTLERLSSLDAVVDGTTRSEFRTVLEAELSDASVREGRIGTGVTVGSLASAGGLDIDIAIVLGAAEGSLPPAPHVDPLLSAHDRAEADLAPPDQRSQQLHHAFVATSQIAHTVVTVPRGDLRATTSNRPSRWLDSDALAGVEIVSSSTAAIAALTFPPGERERRLRDRLHLAARSPLSADHPGLTTDPTAIRALRLSEARASNELTVYDGDLSTADVVPISARRNEPGTRPVSPTQIQTWAACPHAYFVQYLLGVRPLDEPEGQISINALDRGSLQHDVLDRLHRDVLDGRLPQPTTTGWTDDHLAALLAHFDDECERAEHTGRTGRPAAWASDRERMRRDLLGWFERDSARIVANGATILASEFDFSSGDADSPTVELDLGDGRRLAVRGQVDRLDRWADGRVVVTDHKTGRSTAYRKLGPDDPTLDGSVFQLPVYAAAALDRIDDGAGSAPVVRAEYSMFERGRYERIGFDFSEEVWADVTDHLSRVVDGIEGGWYPQLPDRPGFRMFVGCHFCEPDGLGTNDAFERWSRKQSDARLAPWFGVTEEAEEAADDD